MRSLPKFLGLAVTVGLLALGWAQQAKAGCTACVNDVDCGPCGWVCNYSVAGQCCVDKTVAGNQNVAGWCDQIGASQGCACTGAVCSAFGGTCNPDIPPDAGPNPCNVDSECGSCGMVCSYTQNPDSGTVCVLADGGDVGKCDSKTGKTSCGCADQICLAASDTCSPAFNQLDAGPNPCNVDRECQVGGAPVCGTVCYHGASGHQCVDLTTDAGIAGGFCLQAGGADCSCNGQLCDTTTNICSFPDAGPAVDGGPDAGPVDAGPTVDGGPVVYCLADHDCANPLLGSGDGCGYVCGFKTTKPYKCVLASTGDPGICNVSGGTDCLTCGGVTQTCDTASHTCTPPQFMPDAGPVPDSGTGVDSGVADSGTSMDAGLKLCTVDSDCGAVEDVCSHVSLPYHCVLASTGDPGYCTTQSNGSNPCAVQGQTCISNICTPPYGSDGGAGADGGSTSSSSGCSTPAQSGPGIAALLLALGLAGLAGKRRRRLE
jgi:MYXO-CTERM domain-containing protein